MKKTILLLMAIFLIGIVSATYPAYLQDNIVSCWTLDETSGTLAADSGLGHLNNGTNNHGVQIGAASQTASLGKAYMFNKTSTSNISMIPSASLNISQDVSIISILNSTSIGDHQVAGGRINTAGYMTAFTGGAAFTKIVTSGGATAVSGVSQIITGNDVLEVVTHADSNTSIFINGTLEVTAASSSGTITNSNTWALGGTGAFDGATIYLSEQVVLNTTLNSTDNAIIWNGGNILSCGEPVVLKVLLVSPANQTATIETTNYFVASVTNLTAPTIAVKNVSLYLNGTINQTNTSQVTGTYNFSVALPVGVYAWTIKAYGNDSVEYSATNGTFTIGVSKVAFNPSNFSTQAIEQTTQTYKVNFTLGSGYSVSSVNFTFNQTNYTASFSLVNATYYQATASLTTPSVTSNVNKTFNWSVFLTDSSTHTSSNEQQTVLNFGIDNCTTNTIQILNLTLKDEDNQANLIGVGNNTLMRVDVDLYPNASLTTPTFSFSSSYSQTNPARVCVNSSLGGSIFYMNSQIEYSADLFSIEFYNIQNYSLNATNNPSENISLYDLNSSRAQVFTISYKDDTFLAVSGALIQVQRKYVSEGVFKVVEIPMTDVNGEALAHLVLNDVIYSFTIVKDGELLATFNNVYAVCQNPSINDCVINLNSFSSNIPVEDFSSSQDFTYTLTWNETSRVVSTTFSIPSGAVSLISLNVTESDALGTSLCSSSVTTSAGTLDCTIGSSFGNSSIYAYIYKDNILIAQGMLKLDQDPVDIYGGAMVFLGLLVMMTLLGAGLSDSAVLTGVFLVVGVALLFALNLVANNGFIGGTATILFLIVAVILLLIKGARRT